MPQCVKCDEWCWTRDDGRMEVADHSWPPSETGLVTCSDGGDHYKLIIDFGDDDE